jgi:hypothetical protein
MTLFLMHYIEGQVPLTAIFDTTDDEDSVLHPPWSYINYCVILKRISQTTFLSNLQCHSSVT